MARRKRNPAQASSNHDLILIGMVGVGVYVLWQFLKGIGKDTADIATGLITGKNQITKDTPYYGTGVVGTPAAIMNDASAGLFSSFGSELGTEAYDLMNPSYNPNAPAGTTLDYGMINPNW